MRVFLTILFVIVCIVLSVVVLLQEGKSGLGSLAGGNSESFWSKNQSRSAEGMLAKVTRILAIVFFLLALLLNMNLF
jgi:preprotein translocase subunit SecG